jgi:hypothetical protein
MAQTFDLLRLAENLSNEIARILKNDKNNQLCNVCIGIKN